MVAASVCTMKVELGIFFHVEAKDQFLIGFVDDLKRVDDTDS